MEESVTELQKSIHDLESRFADLSKSERKRLNRLRRKKEQYEEQIRREQIQDRIDERYMREAVRQAKKAAELGEVPIGCVIVKDDKIIARGYNRRNTDHSTLSHAEVTAIRKASKKLQDWRLEGCTLYVTLEPCQMCAGAIVQARVPRVVMGCMNPKAGCGGSVLNVLQMKEFNHQVAVKRGVLKNECSAVLSEFFEKMRKQKTDAIFDKADKNKYT
ncbi:MAG: tRNA adenosine(34) deaminase TadA [Lachnospiraceae bacterium]